MEKYLTPWSEKGQAASGIPKAQESATYLAALPTADQLGWEGAIDLGINGASDVSRDKHRYLADAISFAVLERLGLGQAFAFDDHFLQYGFRVLRA